MRRIAALILLVAGALGAACFDFGGYSFKQADTEVAPLAGGSGGAGALPPLGGTAGSSSPGGSSPGAGGSCAEGVGMPGCPPIVLDGPLLGKICQSNSDCGDNACVDGVCCDSPCDELCAACNQPGQEGRCTLLGNDGACPAIESCPGSTECLSYSVPTVEQGNCEARGRCRECQVVPALTSTACSVGGHCNGAGACVSPAGGLKALGQVCASAGECLEGSCALTADGSRVCCNQACDGICQQCSPEGRCELPPDVDPRCAPPQCPADDACNDYPDSPTQGSCVAFGVCAARADVCPQRALRPSAECAGCDQPGGCKLAPGISCQSGTECSTGICSDGVCCTGSCDSCQRCGAAGRCEAIPACECEPGQQSTCGAVLRSQGVCAPRSITCGADRRWPRGTCAGGAERCEDDDVDEDCNGDPNNGCQCLNGNLTPCNVLLGSRGECASRTVQCLNGRWQSNVCSPTRAEVCNNGRDDDCDGSTDEGCLDANSCDFQRSSCQSQQCSRCEGCDPCVRMVACIQETLDSGNPCPTTNDPSCQRSACRATLDQINVDFEGSGAFVSDALQIVDQFVRCSCTR